ncbi:hypothetical protein K2173_008120 [Erythroxylum novogranatense]|uniref:Transmembrane protein n=1 Tax=Erythroxylum novogranatense TaxID=1862640 RepID=A0AAV8S941_9ROSI|nr:hypothetical protein K2173_008120 [Erythroxylum novogranatense]
MDGGILREKDLEVDFESGRETNEEDKSNEHVSSSTQVNQGLERVNGPLGFDGLVNSSKFVKVVDENDGLLVDKNAEGDELQHSLTFWGGKPPKPPRPPKGPLLDAADQKLVQEIAELAIRRRARIERIKALKKMRASKSSWRSSLSAMVVTILFCLVLIFQVLNSRINNSFNFEVSFVDSQFYQHLRSFNISHYKKISQSATFKKCHKMSKNVTKYNLRRFQKRHKKCRGMWCR